MSKQVIMSARYRIPGLNEKPDWISTGGFNFVIDGKEIPFDFNATSNCFENGIITYYSGLGPFFNDFDICEDFEEDYSILGISKEEITAEFLSRVSEINEIFVIYDSEDEEEIEPQKIELLDITFIDENANEYSVAREVIEKFNDK